MKKDNITIKQLDKNQIVDRFFWESINKNIFLEAWANLKYLLISSWSDININFDLSWNWSDLKVFTIFLSKNKEEIKWSISVNLKNTDTKANVYLLSLMGEGAIINVKWNIDIEKWVKWVSGYLLEDNVVLWEKIKINTLPVLNVSSNDVSAWHWAKIQRLDSEKLFYMMSKWLSGNKSKEIIIKWYIAYVLENFDLWEEEKNLIEKLILDYLL